MAMVMILLFGVCKFRNKIPFHVLSLHMFSCFFSVAGRRSSRRCVGIHALFVALFFFLLVRRKGFAWCLLPIQFGERYVDAVSNRDKNVGALKESQPVDLMGHPEKKPKK